MDEKSNPNENKTFHFVNKKPTPESLHPNLWLGYVLTVITKCFEKIIAIKYCSCVYTILVMLVMLDSKALTRLYVCFKGEKVELLWKYYASKRFGFHRFTACCNGVSEVATCADVRHLIWGHFFRSSSHPSMAEGKGLVASPRLRRNRWRSRMFYFQIALRGGLAYCNHGKRRLWLSDETCQTSRP